MEKSASTHPFFLPVRLKDHEIVRFFLRGKLIKKSTDSFPREKEINNSTVYFARWKSWQEIIPYYPGYKAMALFSVQGHLAFWKIESVASYKAMALLYSL